MEELAPWLPAEERCSEAPLGLVEFVEKTTILRLDPWQRQLCERLERLKSERGARVLIHAPPQHGKSILVSQRFPAWLLGQDPRHRVKLACYNITHATGFGKIVLQLMQSEEYERLFPDPRVRVPRIASSERWSTAARAWLRDAQPSFKALGLLTGFVGQGADTLIIDDPYASPQDAASEAIRESVWTFWDESARVRLNEDANVVVMFHRYHEDDLAGRLWKTGGWEMLRYAAVADADPQWPDPMGRAEGEKLSPRFSDQFYADQQQSGHAWLGQFQGRPTAKEGSFFRVTQLKYCDAHEVPPLRQSVRAWDMGATQGSGNPTAGVRIGEANDGRFIVEDVVRGQWGTDARNDQIRATAERDGKRVRIHGPQDPGAAGKDAALAFVRLLKGFSVTTEPVSGDKQLRADPFSAQVNAGNVWLVRAPWNAAFVEELRQFPLGMNDDQVDAGSDAFTELTNGRRGRAYGF